MKRILQEMLKNGEIQQMLNGEVIDFTELIQHLKDIKQNVLYKWDLHGSDHSDKVSLFIFLLAKKYQVSEEELQLLLDAAAYHDIGRTSDAEDQIHGYSSSLQIEEVVNHKIYQNKKNLCYLKAICDAHSVPDNKALTIFENYCEDYPDVHLDFQEFEKLFKILKDADALDRTRFGNNLNASLQANYLRFDYSKQLVEFSSELNQRFRIKKCERMYDKIYNQYFSEQDKYLEKDCLHGIGFNFFKIESILKYGILSEYAAYKKGVSIHRNFNGNNKALWISVVDPNMVDKNAKGYNNFVLKGISFYCFCPKIFPGVPFNNSVEPKYTGEYEDEKFVFDKIQPNQIYAILIPKFMTNKNLLELNYLSGSNNFHLIFETINDYINRIENNSNVQIDKTAIAKLLQQYRDLVISYECLSVAEQKKNSTNLFESADLLKERMNKVIASAMSKYYAEVLSIDEEQLTVKDVVAFELIKAGVNVKNIYDSEEVMIVLDNSLKVSDNISSFHI